MKGPIIEAVGVVKRYSTVEALSGLDPGAHGGEVTAVLGPNGAGTADGESDLRAKIAEMPEADKEQGHMSAIRCEATLFTIGSWTLLRLPKSASAQLPSRGMTMVEGTINGSRFQAPLEPDGKGSHWFRVDESMRDAAGQTQATRSRS